MFQIEVIDKIKTHIGSITFSQKLCSLRDKVEKHGRAGQATDDKMAHALCIPGN